MRLYKVHAAAGKEDSGRAVKWAGSMTDARAAKKAILAEHTSVKPSAVAMDETEVPTNKAGLIEWLNENVKS